MLHRVHPPWAGFELTTLVVIGTDCNKNVHNTSNIYTIKSVLKGHLWDKENMAIKDRWPLKPGSIHMKFPMTGQEEGDLLTQVTA